GWRCRTMKSGEQGAPDLASDMLGGEPRRRAPDGFRKRYGKGSERAESAACRSARRVSHYKLLAKEGRVARKAWMPRSGDVHGGTNAAAGTTAWMQEVGRRMEPEPRDARERPPKEKRNQPNFPITSYLFSWGC